MEEQVVLVDANDNTIENDIIAGVRLSGKVNNNLRVGLLTMQTAEDIENEIAATNNSIIALQHKVFNRSNISFIFINKQFIVCPCVDTCIRNP